VPKQKGNLSFYLDK